MMAPPSKEDLCKLKAAELQRELESRGLDSTGKKADMVDRLWESLQDPESKESAGNPTGDQPTSNPCSAEMLMKKLKLIKERHAIEESRISIRAKAEQDDLRLQTRAEQLDVEIQLAELGSVEEDALKPLRVPVSERQECSDVASVLSAQVRRSLLPPAELRPFTGAVEEFRLFLQAFNSRIGKRTEDKGELLYYLEQYTKGQANQLVRSCLHLDEKGYEEALRLLESRYGNSIRLIDSYIDKVERWSRLQSGDVEGLDRFALFLTEVQNAMVGVTMGEFEHPSTLRLIVSKLPVYLQDRWLREADRMSQKGRRVSFPDIVSFISAEVRAKRSPLFGPRPTVSARVSETGAGQSRHRVSAARVSVPSVPRCDFCGAAHGLDVCQALLQRPWPERRRVLMRCQLCFGCLRKGHRVQTCRRPLQCGVCGGAHPLVLHRESRPGQSDGVPVARGDGAMMARRESTVAPPSSGIGGAVVSASLGLRGASRTALPVVAVRLRGASGKVLVTNALLDQGSSGSFLTERLATRLGVHTERTTVSIETVGTNRRTIPTAVAAGLEVSCLDGGEFHALPTLLTIDSLPVTQDDRCRSGELSSATHLQGVNLCEVDSPVELLLGSNCAALIVAREVRPPPLGEEGLCAVRTLLGWYVMGCTPGTAGSGERLTVNFLRVVDTCASETGSGECLYKKMYEQEFGDLSEDKEEFSVEDREWIDSVSSEIRRDAEGHFVIPLPKVDFGELPDSFQMASRRLESLRKRFRADREYFEMYRGVISSLAEDGYAVPVLDGTTDHPVWYLPHHGVKEPNKDKLRVVFDCAAKSHGVCLNDLLKGGPNLSNSLLGVLCRFREGPVAFTCDVKSMYHRVSVPEPDTHLLRFLWFHDSDPEGEVQVWKMTCHVFGAVSSGSVASYALGCCAEEGRSRFPEAAEALIRRTYVDDVLCATDSIESAVKLAGDLKELCRTGAFNMTKYKSSSSEVLRGIPVQDRGKSVKELDLDKDSLGSDRALGIRWSMEDDSFFFQFRDRQKPVTRRGVLSTVSSIFDPLGMVSPVTLLGRALLQKLCATSCRWDDPLPEVLASKWQEWLALAGELDQVRLNRCITGPPGEVLSTQLHIFADASETAYSAVAYLVREVRTPEGTIERTVQFLMGKSLVNPVRFVSIPRLELAAAVLAVKIRRVLTSELDTVFDSFHMWTDSMVVLGYVRNRSARFKTYVANRVAFIHDGSNVSEWAYVPSRVNPADIGSRGSPPAGLGPWLSGPEFLLGDASDWPVEPTVSVALPDSEVKSSPVAMVSLAAGPEDPVDDMIAHFSSFFRLKRAVAWYRKFCDVLRDGSFTRWRLARRRGLRRREYGGEAALTVSDLRAAERAILRHVQKDLTDFPGTDCDDGPVQVKRSSPLSKLCPYMADGLLVVGGRLARSDSVSEEKKHPVILPRRSHVTRLVIREAHESVGHQGRDHTFWRLRQRFWVIGAAPEIRRMVRSCVTCRRANARPQQQLMADLPKERVAADTPAFSSVLLDVFGPIVVKTGRVERKRYGLMCVCVMTRGVHIELLDSLRSDSLINAIRRISARRGKIVQIRSDMGTNLTGADRELREALRELCRGDLQRAALAQGIDWRFNPPTASHFAGGVERQIRTFRKIWRSMPRQQRVDEESLYTLFCEIEMIMNSRPLTYVSTSSGEIEPLTPGHLLFLRGGAGPIPGVYDEADSLSRRRWRHTQYLAQQFWVRWRREYLLSLQCRQRWTRKVGNLQSGDVVLLVDHDAPRGLWQMGRIVRTLPSQDGLVRKALVKVGVSTYLRPIHKMILIRSEADLD